MVGWVFKWNPLIYTLYQAKNSGENCKAEGNVKIDNDFTVLRLLVSVFLNQINLTLGVFWMGGL